MAIRPAFLGPSALVLVLGLAHPGAAFADAIEPTEAACQGKKKGDTCDSGGKAGTCGDAECCKLDYSQGTPPKSVCSPCLKCGAADASSGDAAPSDTASSETAGGDSALTTDSGGPATPATTSTDKGSGCSALATALPAWSWLSMLAGAIGLVWLRRRSGASQG